MTDSLWWQHIPRNTNEVTREQGEIIKRATQLMELLDEVVPNSTIHYAVEQARMKLHRLIRTAHEVKTVEQTCQECSAPLGGVHGGCCDTGKEGEPVILADTHRLESCRLCQRELGRSHALGCAEEGRLVVWEQTDFDDASLTYTGATGRQHVIQSHPEPQGDCAFPADHHSDDRVLVFHGRDQATVVCGFHASYHWLPEVLNTLVQLNQLNADRKKDK